MCLACCAKPCAAMVDSLRLIRHSQVTHELEQTIVPIDAFQTGNVAILTTANEIPESNMTDENPPKKKPRKSASRNLKDVLEPIEEKREHIHAKISYKPGVGLIFEDGCSVDD